MSIWKSAEDGDIDDIRRLVQEVADIDEKNRYGRTPLMLSAYGGHLAVVRYLVQQGADKKASDQYGITSLHFAAHNGHLDVAQYLVQQGANTEVLDNSNKTPLQVAILYGQTSCIQYLEQHRRFRRLIVHDTREYFTRIGLRTVERDEILSLFSSESSVSETGADAFDVAAVRAEFAAYVAALGPSEVVPGTPTIESSKKRKRS